MSPPSPLPPPEPEDSFDNWDSDPDLALPSGPLRLPALDLDLRELNVSAASLSSGASSPGVDHSEEGGGQRESGFFEHVGAGEEKEESWDEDPANESSMDSSRTSTTTRTLKGLMEGLSLAQESEPTLAFSQPSPPPTSTSAPRAGPAKMTTIRPGSDLSQLLAFASSPSKGRGKVMHLGSTPRGAAVEVGDGDWDQDLGFGDDADEEGEVRGGGGMSGGITLNLPLPVDRTLNKKGSFASHLSLDSSSSSHGGEGDELDGFSDLEDLPASATRRKVSIASFRDSDLEDEGLDFDLPTSQSRLTLSATALQNRGSVASLRSTFSANSAPSSPQPAKATLPVPSPAPSASTTPSPLSLSTAPVSPTPGSETERETSEDDDDDFFSDLVLPSYLGGVVPSDSPTTPSAASHTLRPPLTPPTSEGEPSDYDPPSSVSPSKPHHSQAHPLPLKVDLQSILRAKLEQRGGRGLLFHRSTSSGSVNELGELESPTKEQERLAKHREKENEGEGESLAKELRHTPSSSVSSSASGGGGGAGAKSKGGAGAGGGKGKDEDESWNAHEMRERMRTISSSRAREAAVAKEVRLARRSGTTGSSSSSFVPPLPGMRRAHSDAPISRRPLAPTRSSIPTSSSASSRLGRPSSAQGGSTLLERPGSAASTASQMSITMTRKGPPPAPSVAARDRVRLRTTSLRTVGSSSDLRGGGTGTVGEKERERRPTRLDIPPTQGGGRTLSPVPMTPMSTSTSSTALPRPSLRSKRSQQTLSAHTPSTKSLVKKHSLQNLASSSSASAATAAQTTPSRPTSRQGAPPSFAAPTTASAHRTRTRERVLSVPSPTTPSLFSRLLRPTVSSAQKQQQQQHRPPSRPGSPTKLPRPIAAAPLAAPRPSKGEYGDGTELDAFDDLPVSKEREREGVRVASGATTVGGGSRKSSGASTTTVTGKGGSWGRKSAQQAAGVMPSRLPRREGSAGTGTGEVRGKKEGVAVAKEKKEKEKEKKKEDGLKDGKKKKRREPHLIRHLGGNGNGIKVQGEMTYNPTLHRWEGNESILREFDVALATSTRPALISPFSSTMGSPARSGFPSPPLAAVEEGVARRVSSNAPSGASTTASRAAAKVVGDMVFDPKTCSWHALAGPDAEDELELDWGDRGGVTSGGEGDEEGGNDEGDEGGEAGANAWEKGERERMLKNRASFVLEEGGSSEEDAEGKEGDGVRRGKQTKRRMWRESKAAEERSREELKGWRGMVGGGEEEELGRKWLWELRSLITNTPSA